MSEFDPQGWFEDLSSFSAGAVSTVWGAATGALSVGQDVAGNVSGALSGGIQEVQQQYIEPAVQTVFEAPAAAVKTIFEAPATIQQYIEPAVETVFNVPATIQQYVEPATHFIEDVDTTLASPFVASAAEIPSSFVVTPEPTPAAVSAVASAPTAFSSGADAETKKETASASGLETLANAAVLLGAGVISQIPSWYDIGTNVGTKLADLTYENAVYTKNLVEGRGWGNKTGMVTLGTTPESKLGETTRAAVISEVEKLTGAKISESPITGFFLPTVQKGIQSENIAVRAGAVTEVMGAGLVDWALANPGTAVGSWEVQTADIIGQAVKPSGGDMLSGFGTVFNLVIKSPEERATETVAAKQVATQKTVTKYKVTVASSKSKCWGTIVGEVAGCP